MNYLSHWVCRKKNNGEIRCDSLGNNTVKGGFFWPTFSVFLPKLRQHREQHGDKAGAAAQQVGDGLCPEHAVCAKSCHAGKEDGQRHHDDRLSKQGEKGGVAGLAQSHKDTLPGKLQRHEAEAEEIDVQGGGYRSLPAAGYR